MKRSGPRRGTRVEIAHELWPEIQRRERAGASLQGLVDWLLEAHQITVSKPTMCRAMAKIRAAAPPPPVVLATSNDEDRLKTYREHFHAQVTAAGISAKDQQGALRVTLAIMAELRECKTVQPAQPTATPSPTSAAPPVPELSPEQEADLVRQHLGKRALN